MSTNYKKIVSSALNELNIPKTKLADILQIYVTEEFELVDNVIKRLDIPKTELFDLLGEMSKKKSKKPRDPNAPKRPLSGYMKYCKEMRPQVKKDYPELKSTEIVSKIASMWRELSNEEKAEYKINK